MATHNQLRDVARGALPMFDEDIAESDMASNANAKSDAEWKRCSGFFSRQRCTIRSRAGGVPGVIREISGGSSFKMAVIVSGDVGFLNARLPVSISYRIAPKAKMSVR